MKFASVALALLGLGCGGAAAWFWFCASKVAVIPIWARGDFPFEPVIAEQSQRGWISGLLQASTESARLNKIAAIWTGGSILLSATSTVFSVLANLN